MDDLIRWKRVSEGSRKIGERLKQKSDSRSSADTLKIYIRVLTKKGFNKHNLMRGTSNTNNSAPTPAAMDGWMGGWVELK